MQDCPVPILYEDNHLLVVDKPAGLLSQADHTGDPDLLTLLKAFLVERDHKPGAAWLGLVHRLDRPVSGVMVLAKTSKAASRLSAEIRGKRMSKIYLAVAHGFIDSREGVWRDVLVKDHADNRSRISDSDDGKQAELAYEVLEYNHPAKLSLCTIDLKSGRSHQIRVQFAGRGYPLWGDHRYGGSQFEDQRRQADIALRSWQVRVKHPTRDDMMTFTAPPAEGEPWRKFRQPGER